MNTPKAWIVIIAACAAAGVANAAEETQTWFEFDRPNVEVAGEVLDAGPACQADVAIAGDATWLAWLRYTPGEGDRLWVDRRGDGPWRHKGPLLREAAELANPTLTLAGGDIPWISYERGDARAWSLFAHRPAKGDPFGEAFHVSPDSGRHISHRAAASGGGVWFVWQGERAASEGGAGQWDILARRAGEDALSDIETVSVNPNGDWRPDAAVDAAGRLHVVWDACDGEVFNVMMRTRGTDGRWGPVRAITASEAFEGRARIAADRAGSTLWIAWEEGERNWGKTYRSHRGQDSHKMTDEIGPLHRMRKLRLASLDPVSPESLTLHEVPMPSFDLARGRPLRLEGVREMGSFYERAELSVDGRGRPWLAWRHYYTPWMGCTPEHHVEGGWGVYARALEPVGGWSPLYRFSVTQGDGMQRLAIDADETGIAAVWTEGRTDRREPKNGVRVMTARAEFKPDARGRPENPAPTSLRMLTDATPANPAREHDRALMDDFAEGTGYRLYFGDLHRHTDLSLCFVPSDGTIDDAYRYAAEVAGLDFLGITDHTRDIASGDALSLLWWRCVKEADRHQLAGRFVPLYTYERSRGETDHNVVSLRRDMLRSHDYPHAEFQRELDADSFMIPHQPMVDRALWKEWDSEKRRLMEIYQGFRTTSAEENAKTGLSAGNRFGIIASSDHLSTSASYACVWAKEPTRESIFEGLRARRTYGATARIFLLVRAGDAWMGEEDAGRSALRIRALGSDVIETVEIMADGEPVETMRPGSREIDMTYDPARLPEGTASVYVRLTQADGERAWSSPVFYRAAD